MKRAFEGAVSALCYAFIRAHFGARAGAPGPPGTAPCGSCSTSTPGCRTTCACRFKVLTLLFVRWSGFPRLGSYRSLDADRRWRRIERMRRSVLGPFRDLIRFYEGLTIYGFHEELARASAPAGAGARPSRASLR